MKLAKKLLILILLLTILPSCSNDEKKENGKGKDQVVEQAKTQKLKKDDFKVEPLPNTYEELANLPIGELVDFNPDPSDPEKTVKAFKSLPDISKKPSKKQLDYFYRELLKKVQDHFKGPEDLFRELRFQSIGGPEVEDSRYQFKENLNVEIILDASGSMAQSSGGKSKMAAAKDSITEFVKQLPEGAKVGLRVYGHKGSNDDSAKTLSCSSSELYYSISPYEAGEFQLALDSIQPTGWTPTGLALKEAKKDLEKFEGTNNTNIVYLVSDGVSTCDDDPVQAAKDLYNSNISPIINVIGFDVDAKGQNQLIEIADATKGIYQKVNDESELKNELNRISNLAKTWKDWKEKSSVEIKSKKLDNTLAIFSYITNESYNATFEKSGIGLIIFILKRNGNMDQESYNYLDQKNADYHDWIKSEIEIFNNELKSLNDKGYSEALNALDEKYQKNTQ